MTQQQLADAAGLSRVTVARIERGANPSVTTALRLADALDCRVEDIWTADETLPEALLAAERSKDG